MKIKTKLQIAILIPILMATLMGTGLYFAYLKLGHSMRDTRSAETLIEHVFQLSILTREFILYHTQRSQEQWEIENQNLLNLTKNSELALQRYNWQLGKFQEEYSHLQRVFHALVKNYEVGKKQEGVNPIFRAKQEQLERQALVITQNLINYIATLQNDIAHQLIILQQQIFLVTISVLLAFALFSSFLFFLLGRTIFQSLTRLSAGIELISSGDLHSRIEVNTQDELGVISKAFNQMADNLDDSYQSLKMEIATRKKAEEEKEILYDKLVRSEKLATLGQLSSSISHELRNPLAVIHNSVYFLSMTASQYGEKITKHLEILRREVKRANSIISDLLEFSRTKTPALEAGDINSLIVETLKQIEIPERISAERSLSAELGLAAFDREQIRRVLINILENAVQAITEEGTITVETQRLDDKIHIRVKDSGIGIPHDIQERIFEPLFTTKIRGVGLGLAIVQNIVEKHRGNIQIDSVPGQGTLVTVALLRAK